MLHLHLENLHTTQKRHGLSESELKTTPKEIRTHLKNFHKRNQGFPDILDNTREINKIIKFAKENQSKYDHFVVLGIGGSALGTICLKQTLTSPFQKNKLHIIDNVDPTLINDLETHINLKKTLFIVITKSGTTPETLSQYFYFRSLTDQLNLNPQKHFVFITDPKKGLLRKISKREKIPTFPIPENVGGRFSVLTPVGLLPAALIGIDIKALIKGAKIQRKNFLSENPQENLAHKLAKISYLLYKKKKVENVIMPYSQRLERFADWYRQLLAESIGKTEKIGITPIKALGVTDQHSQNQLYNDGPNNKLITFITSTKFPVDQQIPNLEPQAPEVKYLHQVSFKKLMETEQTATAQALTKKHRPNITITVDSICEQALGELFFLFQAQIAFLGEMFGINAFDQPGVELSKNLTKELLKQS